MNFQLQLNFFEGKPVPIYTIPKYLSIFGCMGHLVTYYRYWRLGRNRPIFDEITKGILTSFQPFVKPSDRKMIKWEVRAVLIKYLNHPRLENYLTPSEKAAKKANQIWISKHLFELENLKKNYRGLFNNHPIIANLKNALDEGLYPIHLSVEETNSKHFSEACQSYDKAQKEKLKTIQKQGESNFLSSPDSYIFNLADTKQFQDKIKELNTRLNSCKTVKEILDLLAMISCYIKELAEVRQQTLNTSNNQNNAEVQLLGQDDYTPYWLGIVVLMHNPLWQAARDTLRFFLDHHLDYNSLEEKSMQAEILIGIVDLITEDFKKEAQSL